MVVVEAGTFLICGVQASHCSGFSRCEAWALGHLGSVLEFSRALEHSLNSCGAWAELLQRPWDLPGSGIEGMFLALAREHQRSPLLSFYPVSC